MYIIFTGASGSGKSTIIRKLIEQHKIPFSVSYTTRKKRRCETEGIDYNFISEEEFKRKIQNDELEEYTIFNNNFYGTPNLKEPVQMFDLEYEGVEYFYKTKKNCLFVFLDIDEKTMKDRLSRRATDARDTENRLKAFYSYQNLKNTIQFDLIVNTTDTFEKTYRCIEDFLIAKQVLHKNVIKQCKE